MSLLPTRGLEPSDLEAQLAAFAARDLPWREGRTYAYVYDAGRELERVGTEAFARYLFVNALDPTAFPSALQLENELVALAANHLNGGPEAVGTFTSGGTESILCAVKAARDWARARRPQLGTPELVLPVTAHPAFHKAAHYLGLKLVLVDVDLETFRADPAAMAAAITPDTIMLVGSAPSYPHGVVDPIAELSALAQERGLWLHVDACVGGWLLPYYSRLGEEVPTFDFSLPGVSSISMDFHKYAFAPKGASVVLYRDAGLRRFQYFGCTDWPGYSLVNPGVLSSKSAGPLAATWAVLQRCGDEGFLELARRTLAGTRRLIEGVAAIPGLRVLGRPDFSLVALASDEVGVFHVVDAMTARGWFIQPQLSYAGCPASIHLSLGPENAERVEELLSDLREAVAEARTQPQGQLTALVQGAFGGGNTLPAPEEVARLMAMAGLGPEGLPERMAPVLEVLDALPRPLGRELLVDYLAGLFVPAQAAAAGA